MKSRLSLALRCPARSVRVWSAGVAAELPIDLVGEPSLSQGTLLSASAAVRADIPRPPSTPLAQLGESHHRALKRPRRHAVLAGGHPNSKTKTRRKMSHQFQPIRPSGYENWDA